MTKIAQNATSAFLGRNGVTRFNGGGNTVVAGGTYRLYHSVIATRTGDGKVFVNFSGYDTKTTKDRINSICDSLGVSRFYTQKGNLMRDGEKVSVSESIQLV